MSKIVCCVKGCGNTPRNTSDARLQIKFYSFPCVSVHCPWKEKKRKQWIKAIIKNTSCSEDWMPTQFSRICSAHFFGNAKSEHPLSPSFLPRIFPEKTEPPTKDQSQQTEENQVPRVAVAPVIWQMGAVKYALHIKKSLVNVGCQTEDLEIKDDKDCDNYDSCFQIVRDKFCDVALQVFIKKKPEVTDVAESDRKSMKDASTSSSDLDDNLCVGFQGLQSIKTNNIMNALTGVSFETFNVLMSMLSSNQVEEIK